MLFSPGSPAPGFTGQWVADPSTTGTADRQPPVVSNPASTDLEELADDSGDYNSADESAEGGDLPDYIHQEDNEDSTREESDAGDRGDDEVFTDDTAVEDVTMGLDAPDTGMPSVVTHPCDIGQGWMLTILCNNVEAGRTILDGTQHDAGGWLEQRVALPFHWTMRITTGGYQLHAYGTRYDTLRVYAHLCLDPAAAMRPGWAQQSLDAWMPDNGEDAVRIARVLLGWLPFHQLRLQLRCVLRARHDRLLKVIRQRGQGPDALGALVAFLENSLLTTAPEPPVANTGP